ncbi:hypothetical protein JCM30760_11070 [Thiomicrorhabdus hydrogeniphila]
MSESKKVEPMPKPMNVTDNNNKENKSNTEINVIDNSNKSEVKTGELMPEIKSFPNASIEDSNTIPMTLENFRYLIDSHDIKVGYDLTKKAIDIQIPKLEASLDNHEEVKFNCIVSLCRNHNMSTTPIKGYLLTIADSCRFNPVKEWINSRQWDGQDRLTDFYDTVIEQEEFPEELKKILMRKWLVSAVAAAHEEPGFKARGVLTFQGKQGIGKTTWVRNLMPIKLSLEYIKVDHHLDPSNKDSVTTAISHWIVEIGEVDSSFKKDMSRLKGFLTSDYDKLRLPYAATISKFPRRTVFFASVNQHDFLVDNTGNSRWWTIPVKYINFNHEIDMQQVFAQVAVIRNQGEKWWLTPDEEAMLGETNKSHQVTNLIRDTLIEQLDLDRVNEPKNQAMTASQVLKEVVKLERPTNAQARECGSVLRELLGEPRKIQGLMKWRIPIRIRHPDPNHDKRNVSHINDVDEDGY